MSSEESVFDMQMMKENASLLVMGVVPFRTFAASYNRRFGYNKVQSKLDGGRNKGKRMKRFVTITFLKCSNNLQRILNITAVCTIWLVYIRLTLDIN